MRLGALFLMALLWVPTFGWAQQPRLLTPPGETTGIWGAIEAPDSPGPHPAVILLYGSSGWRPETVASSIPQVRGVVDYFGGGGSLARDAGVPEIPTPGLRDSRDARVGSNRKDGQEITE